MSYLNAFLDFFFRWSQSLFWLLHAKMLTADEKNAEIIALRSQLSVFQEKHTNHKIIKHRLDKAFRQLWVVLSKCFPSWQSALIVVKPETVIRWHKTAFKLFWSNKSKKTGRPHISTKTIALIRKIHKENPLLSPEKIREKLIMLTVKDAPCANTIAKYISKIRKSPSKKHKQSWKTFLNNHSEKIWAMDFFVVPTITFRILYVFILLSHDRRKIEHFAITSNPSSTWVAQQIRNSTEFGKTPEYLIHDNDSIFTSKELQEFLANCNIKSKRTGYRSPWQNAICERTIGILRRELLDHIIPFNEKHLAHLLKEYVHKYFNSERTHQGIECQTPIPRESPPESLANDTKLKSSPILGGLYHTYRKTA